MWILVISLYFGSPEMKVHTSLQALDTASTLYLLDNGGVERNPLMEPIVDDPARFIAVKTAVTALVGTLPPKYVKPINYLYGGIVLNNLYQICR